MKKRKVSDKKYEKHIKQSSNQINSSDNIMESDWQYYERKINNIWNKQIDPIFKKSNADFFKEKKLLYEIPLADILSIKDKVSPREFKEIFPLTVGELLEVVKSENETEQHALTFICAEELSARGWALRELL